MFSDNKHPLTNLISNYEFISNWLQLKHMSIMFITHSFFHFNSNITMWSWKAYDKNKEWILSVVADDIILCFFFCFHSISYIFDFTVHHVFYFIHKISALINGNAYHYMRFVLFSLHFKSTINTKLYLSIYWIWFVY